MSVRRGGSIRYLSWAFALRLTLWLVAGQAHAHPLAPGLLVLSQLPDDQYSVMWKIPTRQAPGVYLQPLLPERCSTAAKSSDRLEGGGRVERWRIDCGSSDLSGETIGVRGIDTTPSGVLLRVELKDGRHYHQMLTAEQRQFTVPDQPSVLPVLKNYTRLGFEHLISGIDHVLFVLALTLLVGWGRRLFYIVTLFTVAHSVTLALAASGYVRFPAELLEALIAFSVIVAAVELVRGGKDGLFQRRPWVMSGGFGLLHGLGFAGALSGVGLPAGEIPLALAAFNIGIEVGQLAVIGAFIVVWWTVRQLRGTWPAWIRLVPAYGIGSLAALWFWERLLAVPVF